MERGQHESGEDDALQDTVNTRYRRTCYRRSHVTGNRIVCTIFPPPNRLRYRHTKLRAHQKAIFCL